LALLDVFFPYEIIAESTAHGSRDGSKKPLEHTIMDSIKSKCMMKFPLQQNETLKDALTEISKAVTDKCLGVGKRVVEICWFYI
jgi:hypothetical protein